MVFETLSANRDSEALIVAEDIEREYKSYFDEIDKIAAKAKQKACCGARTDERQNTLNRH